MHAVVPMPEQQLRTLHPIVAMLRTLLPWTDAGVQPEYGEPQQPAAPPANVPDPAGGDDHGARPQLHGPPDGGNALADDE